MKKLSFKTKQEFIAELDVFYTKNNILWITETLEKELPSDFSGIVRGTYYHDEQMKFIAFYSKTNVLFLSPSTAENKISMNRDISGYKIGIYCTELYEFIVEQIENDIIAIPYLNNIKLEYYPTIQP
ncbi:MAG: hypothetical protein E7062_09470 [Spirochaetaceae bacterium]|nr:hypothetical protein [Spirochaetaceae bacterium]